MVAAAQLTSACAQSPGFELRSPEEVAAINRIEAYLNDITTMQARFVQLDPNGEFSEGDMYLSRPGKMRFQFDPPNPILLVADGFWFIYVDQQLEQATHIPLGSTPASFLLDEELTFGEEYTVIALSQANGLVVAEIINREEPGLGSVQLVFNDQPFELTQWTITDAQGLQTRVTFTETRFGHELARNLFFFDTNRFRRRD
ncbi:MAG: outer membrane lipoprotein carrier protein LolA [Alphaproteobacteria bacterium]|nr:outer membrane lipoprotein carrier protein LolA [Alphaproteobacteria bacterium]